MLLAKKVAVRCSGGAAGETVKINDGRPRTDPRTLLLPA